MNAVVSSFSRDLKGQTSGDLFNRRNPKKLFLEISTGGKGCAAASDINQKASACRSFHLGISGDRRIQESLFSPVFQRAALFARLCYLWAWEALITVNDNATKGHGAILRSSPLDLD